MKITHFMMVPFSGLGLYNGFRGNRWLKNRIRIFLQFVVPSLKAQTDQNFILWVAWRREEKTNNQVKDLKNLLDRIFGAERVVFTFGGVPFWDDKYPKAQARSRLIETLHNSMGDLIDYVGDVDNVLMTIQPSDDCYNKEAVAEFKEALKGKYQAAGYTKGYISNYQTKEVKEYNPKTNPPFFTIKFTKEDFIDPLKHFTHTGPYESHEYVPEFLEYKKIDKRGFLVGTHFENISTVFDHPYAGTTQSDDILELFGLQYVDKYVPTSSIRRVIFHRMPYKVKRKLRYWAEKTWIFSIIYNFLRG